MLNNIKSLINLALLNYLKISTLAEIELNYKKNISQDMSNNFLF